MEIDLMMLLAGLTPSRHYYPAHLRVMQKVVWATLSPLSQHNSFCESVLSILEQAKTLSLFDETASEVPDTDICDNQDLLERAAIRDSANRVHGFGAENHTTEHDVFYISRDHICLRPHKRVSGLQT